MLGVGLALRTCHAATLTLLRLQCRPKDVGKPKAEVAAARVMERIAGVTVTPHFCRIEDKPVDWYRDFHVIALGLDSLEARGLREYTL